MDAKIEASIVIPVYNSSSYIIETIESVALSCYGISFEIILVDDVSDDIENLRAIIQKYSYVRLIEKHIKSNASESRNIGIRSAQYNHIFLLDADDFFTKEYVKHRLDLMQRKNCGVFFGAYNAVSPNGVVKPHILQYSGNDMRDYLFIQGGDIRTSTISINRLYHKNTFFDEKQWKHQDWGFGIRCFNNNEDIGYDDVPLINICSGRHFQMSGKMNIEASEYFIRHYLTDVSYYPSFVFMHYLKAIIQSDQKAIDYFDELIKNCILTSKQKIKYSILKAVSSDFLFKYKVGSLRFIKKIRSGYI
ncbi:glycosyltransferase family 2 protein [Klebsiella quasipneumoniae]|uniref:glycosyltransferase family 2 protein n=1 Tax=Klebsiella quasipneumoniae TaxID=1463165 RepID=UPI000DC79BC2|nr:glycosyltransferase family 2 protein [Klebsiella quasipneumoniae]AWX86770.1 glycosyltransferase family 2 protein [Klebsiella quasipneumoniae subsp. quasipneumoniae]MCS6402309.1 glycosyltransferase [Klebsiella quasipneumoniae subsp. quasipneumoniae]QEY77781.1 glycosyltransferase family 2 protein [Klebsiella quasipneumoniae]